MSDQIFANPRLVSIYDHFDGERQDLTHYVSLAKELEARTVLDIGSGTGCLAHLLAAEGFQVTALEPAKASLDFARLKPGGEKVRWIHGFASGLPPLQADLAMMTGNVAQVFLTDQAWEENLAAIHRSLSPRGHLVFETRNPARKAWLEWHPQKTYERQIIPGVGAVEGWCELKEVSGDLVSFRWTYRFESDGEILSSDSTLRFRERSAIETALAKTGFKVLEVRDAPDRPGKELVFIAARRS